MKKTIKDYLFLNNLGQFGKYLVNYFSFYLNSCKGKLLQVVGHSL